MNVTELIRFVGKMSFGNDSPTQKQKDSYLECLNIANLEYFQVASAHDNNILILQDVFLNGDDAFLNIPVNIYCIKEIYNNEILYQKEEPRKFYKISYYKYQIYQNRININKNSVLLKVNPDGGLNQRYLTLLHVRNPKKLVENVADGDLEISSPIYPKSTHFGLIQGALYYIFMTNKGFPEKLALQLKQWEKAKIDLATAYNNGAV